MVRQLWLTNRYRLALAILFRVHPKVRRDLAASPARPIAISSGVSIAASEAAELRRIDASEPGARSMRPALFVEFGFEALRCPRFGITVVAPPGGGTDLHLTITVAPTETRL
jgi:hypothetical protein